MKNFFTSLSLITLGILIAVTVIQAPSYILPASATLPTEAIFPLIDETTLLTNEIISIRSVQSPVPFALPNQNINISYNYGQGPTQMDINGDGLVDLVYSFVYSLSTFQYVLLNNGQGFSKAYVCKVQKSTTLATTYQGDCADPNYTL